MIEAKTWEETVVHADGCNTNLGIIGAICNCGSEVQAQHTWDIAYKAGEAEVVEWIKTEKKCRYINNVLYYPVYEEALEAKIKDWGI